MLVAVTGASGMVGCELCQHLLHRGFSVRAIVRIGSFFPKNIVNSELNICYIKDIANKDDLIKCFEDVYCVIHCASMVHDTHSNFTYSTFHHSNVYGSFVLSQAAIEANVKKVIFLSTVAVYGVNSNNNEPFSEDDTPNPIGNYAISKFYAEKVLSCELKKSNVKLFIIRSPMILSSRAVGNVKKMLWLLSLKIPLPLKSIKNKKSILSIFNLLNFVEVALLNQTINNEIFNISDDEDYSTPDLILKVASLGNARANLFNFPIQLFLPFLYLIRKEQEFYKLTDSFQVANSKAKNVLNWSPRKFN